MCSAKGKILAAALLFGVLSCAGCGRETEEEPKKQEETAEEIPESSSTGMEGSIEVTQDLPDREISVPEHLKDDTGPAEDTEETPKRLSGEEQAEEARQIADHIEESIDQVLTDKDYYPNITGVSVNPECTEFNVTLSGREISLYENVLPLSLCIVGDKFQLYQGKSEDELMTVVNYIDESTGEIFQTINSEDIQ